MDYLMISFKYFHFLRIHFGIHLRKVNIEGFIINLTWA